MEEKRQSRIIYGCMGLGGGWTRDPISGDDEKQANAAIEAAIDYGIDTFDHADIYGYGKSEIVFGRVLKGKPGLREKIFIQSKAGICLKTGPNNSNTYNFSQEYLETQIETSLRNLNTDYLDVFLLHRPDPLVNPEEIAETFRFLKNRGLVKSFGVSNMSVMQMEALQKFCDEPLVANQIQFGLRHTLLIEDGVFVNIKREGSGFGIEGMLSYAQINDIEIQAWRPLDKGIYARAQSPSDDADVLATRLLVKVIAEKYKVDAAAILLAWVLMLPCRISPIIGTTVPLRIKSAVDSLKVNLSRNEWYQLWLTANCLTLP